MQATSELVNCRAPLPTKRKRSFGASVRLNRKSPGTFLPVWYDWLTKVGSTRASGFLWLRLYLESLHYKEQPKESAGACATHFRQPIVPNCQEWAGRLPVETDRGPE